jgi:hypothetical protein
MFFLKTSRDELISLACVAGVVERVGLVQRVGRPRD